jgi:hypothetical protein
MVWRRSYPDIGSMVRRPSNAWALELVRCLIALADISDRYVGDNAEKATQDPPFGSQGPGALAEGSEDLLRELISSNWGRRAKSRFFLADPFEAPLRVLLSKCEAHYV